jgi:integrase
MGGGLLGAGGAVLPGGRWATAALALVVRTIALLHDHRRRQVAERLTAGPVWSTELQDQDLVFTRPDGTAIPPKRASQQFTRQVDAAGLPRIGVHGLRHTWPPSRSVPASPSRSSHNASATPTPP